MAKENGLLKLGSDFSKSVDRILFRARQKTFGEAFIADSYDDVLAIVPVIGDIIGTGPRIIDASGTEDKEAGAVRAANSALGIIPGIGFFLDLAFPASGIITWIDYTKCVGSGKDSNDCLFPKDTIERDLINMDVKNLSNFDLRELMELV